MIELNIENNPKKTSRKIPLVLLFLILLGGIFLFTWFIKFYHQDNIDNFISDKVSFYSHWQLQKISKIDNENLNLLIDHLQESNIFPENIDGFAELAIIYFEDQWLFVYKPMDMNNYQNAQYKKGKYIIHGITKQTTFQKLINEKDSLSNYYKYKTEKRADTSLINAFINNPSFLTNNSHLMQYAANISQGSFWKINVNLQTLEIVTNNISNSQICENNIKMQGKFDYKYYINNLSTQNNQFPFMNLLNNSDICVDLVIDMDNNWHILAQNNQKHQIQNSISVYLAAKYPFEKTHILPDNSKSIHIISNTDAFQWKKIENVYKSGNDQEEYNIFEYNEFLSLSATTNQLDQSNTNQNQKLLTDCQKDVEKPNIVIKDPANFIFNNIYIGHTHAQTTVCIH